MNKVWANKDSGFTIVELLIVVVVIAILAAITIVSYNGIQQQAKSAQQSTTVGNWQTALNLAVVQGVTIPTSANAICLGNASDYPAEDNFSLGQCVTIKATGVDISIAYDANNFSSWTAGKVSVPSAKTPTVSVVAAGNLTYRARGVWLQAPVIFEPGNVITMAWVPFTPGKCNTGTLSGGICRLEIPV